MSDIKLFAVTDGTASEILGTAVVLEKSLQSLIEHNLEALLGVRFLSVMKTPDRGSADFL